MPKSPRSIVYIPNAEAAYRRSVSPKALVEIAHTRHYAFSNGCFPGPDCNHPVTLSQAEANTVVLRWAVPFLEWRLKGDDTFAAFFEAPQPVGVTVQQAG